MTTLLSHACASEGLIFVEIVAHVALHLQALPLHDRLAAVKAVLAGGGRANGATLVISASLRVELGHKADYAL